MTTYLVLVHEYVVVLRFMEWQLIWYLYMNTGLLLWLCGAGHWYHLVCLFTSDSIHRKWSVCVVLSCPHSICFSWLRNLNLSAYVDNFSQQGLCNMFELNDFTLEVCSLPVKPHILTYKNVHVFNGILLCYHLFKHDSEYFRDLTYHNILCWLYTTVTILQSVLLLVLVYWQITKKMSSFN